MYWQKIDSYLKSSERAKIIPKLYSNLLKIAEFIFYRAYQIRKWAYGKNLPKRIRVSTPVISVGNITWGGTGKTPFVIYLASRLEKSGKKVVVLTRGYLRKSRQRMVLSGSSVSGASWTECGDEPFMLAKALPSATIVIDSKRAKAAVWAEQELKPDLILLDDGFQHWKLARDLDIVLLSPINPLGNRELIPLGTLREPPEALSRADLTVCNLKTMDPEGSDCNQAVSRYLKGELIQTRYRLNSVNYAESGRKADLKSLTGKKVLGFCGIGEPDYFYKLLSQSGLNVVRCVSFPDHYAYNKMDLLSLEKEALTHDAKYLITTAKDGLKIPDNLQLKLPLLIFEINLEVVRGEEVLWERINQVLKK
ncbi:MAG: tetraacyldisaccharide 4'-kinase [candidate division Zixibacteria bacterium]|nr:tetraacyldisaccharide 4'-kinase [candidate division Zixibacteria bacterium]